MGFIRKEFYHIFRDRRTMAILFLMPLLQLILFGYAIRNELNEADVAILDHSKDSVTRNITDKLLSSGHFKLAADLEQESEIGQAFQQGVARNVIVFEPLFEQKLRSDGQADIQIITDASDPMMAQMLEGYTTSIIQNYQQTELEESGSLAAGITPEVRMLYNPELRSSNMFVPGLIAFILMLVCAFMTSITLSREKETGTMEVLLASPLRPMQIIIGKVLPYLALSLINIISVLIVATVLFDVPFRGSYGLFFGLSVLFIMTALALGVRISVTAKDQQTAMMMSLGSLLFPTVFLSGFIFPIENMPAILQYISHAVPAKWYLISLRGIMLKGVGIEYLWMETLILFGMMVFLILVSIRSFKIRLE